MSISSHPLVSVVMPAYNVEAYLEKAIQSILNQTYTRFELIVADDGSKDSTVAILSSFEDPRIVRILHAKNLGYEENMNALFRAAKGEFIVIQDADDYCSENRLQVLLDFLTAHPDIDMVGSSYVKVNEEQKEEQVPAVVGVSVISQSFQHMTDPLPVLNGAVMFRRKIVDLGFFYRKLKYINRGQDDDWLFRVSESFKIDNVAAYLYYYRSNASSMTLNPESNTYYSIFAGDYVRFLKDYRNIHGIDALQQNKWADIESFFLKEKNKITATEPAYLELYIAHKYLGQGKRLTTLKWLLKALWKDRSNFFIWKKIGFVILNKN